MVSFIKPSAAANMKQYLMPSYGEIMKHALTCKAIGAEVCSSVWCEFVLVKVNMNQLGVILYLNMYVCKFEPIQHVFRQKAFCKESILFHSYTLFYSLQRGQGIFIAINYTHVFSGDPDKELAYQWFRRAEHHIDSLIDVEPSPGLYNDLLPVAYILKGKEAAMEVMDKMAEPEKSIARNFFVEYPDRQTFLNEMVSMFDSCQYECLTQEDGLHANEE